MLRWHLQEGRSAIPKSTRPQRIAENFDIFDFELTPDEISAIDALDTGVRGGPDPEDITLEDYGKGIPRHKSRRPPFIGVEFDAPDGVQRWTRFGSGLPIRT
jgi:hypothetical protein